MKTKKEVKEEFEKMYKTEIDKMVSAKVKELQPPQKKKDKTTAVLLAVFFSAWTFLYTYKKDATKFWVCLLINIFFWWLFFIPNLVIWVYTVVKTASREEEFYETF